MTLTCGQCRGCRAALARSWSMRIMHEASLYDANVFATLTYDDESLPPGGSLRKRDLQLFLKRLRREIEPARVRYFAVGEYGTRFDRPHYHALLFGFVPSDARRVSVRQGHPVFSSVLLDRCWGHGLTEFGSVTPASARYVAGYVQKRITGSWSKARYGEREPEFGVMSRRPGIGAAWIDKYREEVYAADSVVVNGREVKPPRYYDQRVASSAPLVIDGVKAERFVSRNREEERPERLAAREAVQAAQEALYSGGEL